MTIEKSHHYLPQIYLKNFTNKKGKLNQHFKHNNKIHIKSPNKVAFENQLYERYYEYNSDTEIEKYFHKIENSISEVFLKFSNKEKNFINNLILTPLDIEKIIWFISCIYWRQRKAIKSYSTLEKQLVEKGKLSVDSKNVLYSNDLHQNVIDFNETIIRDYIVTFQYSLGSEFVLAENGIVLDKDLNKSISYFFPLTPKVMIALTKKISHPLYNFDTDHSNKDILVYSQYCSEEFVNLVNTFSIHQSERYYYSRPK